MTGIVLTLEWEVFLHPLPPTLSRYLKEDNTSAFSLATYDLLELGSRMYFMDILNLAEGVVQLIDVSRSGYKLDNEAKTLLQGAHNRLEVVYQHASFPNPLQFYYIGKMYHHDGILYLLDTDSRSSNSLARALEIYNEVVVGEKETDFRDPYVTKIVFDKGVLNCELFRDGASEEEGVALFYQVRGNAGDALLVEQLELYKEQLLKLNSDEHIMRVTSIATSIGKACIDPCSARPCLLVAELVMTAVKYLFMSQMLDSWDDTFNESLSRVVDLFDAIVKEDRSHVENMLVQFFSQEVNDISLAILFKVCAVRGYLADMVGKKIWEEKEKFIVVHPSVLLRRVIHEVRGIWATEEIREAIDGCISLVIETRSVNHWRPLRAGGQCPEWVYGCTTVVVGDKIYLFGGHNGKTRNNRMYAYDIELNKWSLLEVSGTVPSPRQGHSANLINEVEILLWGGRGDNDYLSDAFIFNTEKQEWRQVLCSGHLPSPRSGFATCRVGNHLYFMGGKVSGGTPGFTVVHILDLETMFFEIRKTWGDMPLPDYNFATACINGDVIYKFGGEVGGNDLYALNTETLRWYFCNTGGSYPSYDETQDSLSFVAINDKLIMFGVEENVYCLHLGLIPSDHTLYNQYFDPMGTKLAQGNWKECDADSYPTEERKYYASCVVGHKIYTHGGQDNFGIAVEEYYIYDTEQNTWEKQDIEKGDHPGDIFGHTMTWDGADKIYLFGGKSEIKEEAAAYNHLYQLDIPSNTWTLMNVEPAESLVEQEEAELTPRAFHCAVIHNRDLILWGGAEDDIGADRINLDTMRWDRLATTGDLPRKRQYFAWCHLGDKVYIMGGQRGEARLLSSCDVFDLSQLVTQGTVCWQNRRILGDPPDPAYDFNLCAYGKYLFKYGGTTTAGQCPHLSILNTEASVSKNQGRQLAWESEIDTTIEPMEGHHAYIIGKKMFVIEAGFEVSYLEIDSGDRLGLFKKLKTYGERHQAKRASTAVWNGTTAYIFGGLYGGAVAPIFSAVDFEIDCFREEELELAQLPPFVQQNRHLKVTVQQGRKMPPRGDGEVCDPYLLLIDEETNTRQSSAPCEATLSPTFNHDFLFYHVKLRKDTSVLLEIRDAKDDLFIGKISIPLAMIMRMCTKQSANFEKWYKLERANSTLSTGEIKIRATGF